MLIRPRITGLDLTPGRLVAVELSRRGIERAVAVEPADGDPARLAARLAQGDLATSRIHLVGWDASHLHRTMLLPRMSRRERAGFLERELTRGEDGQTRLFDAQVVRQVAEGAATKDEVLIAAGPRESFERLLTPLLARRLTPRLVTTAPLALVAAAHALAPEPILRPAIAVDYGATGLTLAVMSDGVLKLARQVPRLVVADVDLQQWMTAEIQRSLRHYAQIAKGERVEAVYLGATEGFVDEGTAPRAELEARLGLPVTDLTEALELRLLEGAARSADAPAGVFLLAFGAATLTPGRTPNLVPPALVRAGSVRRLRRGGLVAAGVVALVMAAAASAASREATALRAEVDRLRKMASAVQVQASETGRIAGEREQIRQWLRLLADDPLRMSVLGDALKEVSRLAPDELRLERLAVTRGERGYAMKLAGTVAQADLAEAQATFNRLYFGLRESLLFHHVGFSLVKPAAAAPAAPDAKPAPPPFPVAFEVTLQLKAVGK